MGGIKLKKRGLDNDGMELLCGATVGFPWRLRLDWMKASLFL